jgi:hypothetical protein
LTGGPVDRAPVFTFFNLKISLKVAGFEEKIHREVKKVEEVFKGKPLFSLYFFDLFDLVVKNSSFQQT